MPTTPHLRFWLFLLCACLAACSTAPDKRLLDRMNQKGFGKKYTGNVLEENYATIGDTISISDPYNKSELTLSKRIDIDGTILLPELGSVAVAGYTRTELEALLMEKYSPYYPQLDIKVDIANTGGSKKYFIYGEVAAAGEKTLTGDETIFEAVMKASPKDDTANLGRVRLIKADPRDPEVYEVNIGDLLENGDSSFNMGIEELDIIFVPPTMLAQLGYFLDSMLFPVKKVLSGIGGAFFSLNQFSYYNNNVLH
ncbi:MAG: polysaccharide biosynthesis/export family protein [Planctomycetes bacterium]|nr:polysaccharide biosynthesis/export family protein [Planctomycetota bacterium]